MGMEGSENAELVGRPARAGALIGFFLLTYAVTWSCFIPVAAGVLRANTLAGYALLLVGTFAPSLVAVLLTWSSEGAAGIRVLLRGVVQWQVAGRWYLFAVSYIAVVKVVVSLLHRAVLGAWPRFGTEPLYLIPFAIALSTPVQSGEEIGWRGYALPRMASRMGLRAASVVLGIIWACWHLPLFFVPEADTYQQSFAIYALQVTALSVAIAWLYGNTRKSLLLPMLLHAAVNNSKDIVPSALPVGTGTFRLDASPVEWMTVGLLWICAAYFLARMPKLET